ncbi:MAG: TIGR01777 family oxidoreductase [Pseudomonadota bacterium]
MESRQIAIAGATGLVGTELYNILGTEGRPLSVVGRSIEKLRNSFPDADQHLTWNDFADSNAEQFHTIVNLAGATVADLKWTDEYKKVMMDSRLNATRECVKLCQRNPDIRLINASAVSAYGFYTEPYIRFTEENTDKRHGTAFLQEMIDRWEEEASKAREFGTSLAMLRIGVVLHPEEGPLPLMARQTKFFLGGPIGSGEQIMSWISSTDLARIIQFLIENPDITGPVNCTAPLACSNRAFSQALGKAMGRPSFFRTPAFVIRAAMGQMGDELVVHGQHVYPEKLLNSGFAFQHGKIEEYFSEIFPN